MTHDRTPTDPPPLRLSWGRERYGRGPLQIESEVLTITGGRLHAPLRLLYTEVYLRRTIFDKDPGMFMRFETELRSAAPDGRRIELHTTLEDGVVIDHVITAGDDEVDLRFSAHNPTETASELQYTQPCLPVDEFTGTSRELGSEEFFTKSFIVTADGVRRLSELPDPKPVGPSGFDGVELRWHLWVPDGLPPEDRFADGAYGAENSPVVPVNGIVGCFSPDEDLVVATAWEPLQVMHQAHLGCIHSCPRIGGLEPGETKTARGRLYVVPDVEELARRHARDFPEQTPTPV